MGNNDQLPALYKLWLGLSILGKSGGFSKASFYPERLTPNHATAHKQKRCKQFKNMYIKFNELKIDYDKIKDKWN